MKYSSFLQGENECILVKLIKVAAAEELDEFFL